MMSRSTLTTTALLTSVCAAFGCYEPETCADVAAFDPSVTLGVGEQSFTPLADGAQVDLDFGAQGGQHIWIGLKTTGFAPGGDKTGDLAGPEIRYTLLADDADIVGEGSRYHPLDGDASSAECYGDTLFVDWFDGSEYENYTVRASIIDACGTAATTERTVLLDL